MEDKPRLLGLHAKNSKADSLYLLACRLFMKIYAKPICASALPSFARNVIRMGSKVIRITLRAGKKTGPGALIDYGHTHARGVSNYVLELVEGGYLCFSDGSHCISVSIYSKTTSWCNS